MSTNRKHTNPADNANHVTIIIAKAPGDDNIEVGDYMKSGEFKCAMRHYIGYEIEKWMAGKFLGRFAVTKMGLKQIAGATPRNARPAPAVNLGRKIIVGSYDGLIRVGQLKTSKVS